MLRLSFSKLSLLFGKFIAAFLILGMGQLGTFIVQPILTFIKLLEESLSGLLSDVRLVLVFAEPGPKRIDLSLVCVFGLICHLFIFVTLLQVLDSLFSRFLLISVKESQAWEALCNLINVEGVWYNDFFVLLFLLRLLF